MKGLLIILTLITGCIPAMAITWRVSLQGPLRSVQQAIRQAKPGDTIEVMKGIYYEKNLVVDKPVYLKGINYPVLDGEHTWEIITVKASRVTIEGFRIQHSGHSSLQDIAGIKISNAQQVTVRNNQLDDNYFGVFCESALQCRIINNTLRSYAEAEFSSGDGIHAWKSDSLEIAGNTITGFRDGIYFEFVTNSFVRQNTSENNIRYGLHFMFSHNDEYTGNTFRKNGTGVTIMYTHGIIMRHNVFTENWGSASFAVLMKDISDSQVENNRFEQNTVGIYMEGSNRLSIRHNRFKGNGWALKIQASCGENTITRNNFSANTFDVATNGSLVLNDFTGNYWDKYEGYDLNRDGIGDVPYRPVSLYSMIVERNPGAMMLFRSFMVSLLDKAEKVLPGVTPVDLKDDRPFMKPLKL